LAVEGLERAVFAKGIFPLPPQSHGIDEARSLYTSELDKKIKPKERMKELYFTHA
jgi:hypothetical protein